MMREDPFTADLHCHSNRSYDSMQSPETVIKYASKAGLDAVAITDHDEFGAHKAITDNTEIMVIPGVEVRTEDYDDLLALFVDEPIESREFRDAVAEIHELGGLAILPHPYRKVAQYEDEIFGLVDGIEAFNARSKAKNNEQAVKLARKQDLPTTGGSDAHTPWEIGRGRTVVRNRSISSPADLAAAIRDGDVGPVGTESPYYLYHGLSVAMETIKSVY